ncbi:MAG: hypothetical protein HQK53_15350 [Oligoflexia bacterium]|nr:hypothetical protein [Oligoflexia bacterium]
MESGIKERDSLEATLKCEENGERFFKDIILWRMAKISKRVHTQLEKQKVKDLEEELSFQLQEKKNFKSGRVYFDSYNGLYRNIEYLFNDFIRDKDRFLFLVRDFSYRNTLKAHDLESAREILVGD